MGTLWLLLRGWPIAGFADGTFVANFVEFLCFSDKARDQECMIGGLKCSKGPAFRDKPIRTLNQYLLQDGETVVWVAT
jgi:hypothetical protein